MAKAMEEYKQLCLKSFSVNRSSEVIQKQELPMPRSIADASEVYDSDRLFNAPAGTAGVRKPVRVGCLNLVLKTCKTERPREYISVGLSSNHAGWDSQWFFLRNDDGLLPAYTGHLITERLENWTYGVVQGPIDVWSSRPKVKEDKVDRDKRRQSAEKQKSAKDSEKKKEKTKNLDRQALEAPLTLDCRPVLRAPHPVPWPRKKEEEGREQETRQQPQEEQRLQPKEGEEGQPPASPQLEELLEQDRQQELQELQEQQRQRGQ
ncbi:uncharacterized protein LOC110437536 [Sorghum bicolor]|uniref:uncharacterized protein LOC110437536 n=1 Tax=Sorghum bicolor TaxID=4558 RepID=UPI000B4254FB|nr:uncharacterized protein LOC110437536 [Sorghum bicolor]|eukprot:XP_021321682.1 uncharacterized protein LOC110437536 [Sorghum bicolor]